MNSSGKGRYAACMQALEGLKVRRGKVQTSINWIWMSHVRQLRPNSVDGADGLLPQVTLVALSSHNSSLFYALVAHHLESRLGE